MSTYTAQYTRPYADGYKDRPDESTPEYARFINARDDALLRIEAFLAALNIPSKLSELVNDEGFIDATVSNLANYYLKSETYARTETYTQSEVQALIADAVSEVSGKLNISVVDALPTSDISTTTFYLVPKETSEEKNLYDEYINTDGTESGWELIGAVSTSIELSEYCKKTELEALLAEKVNTSDLVASSFSGTKAVIGNQVSSGGGSALHNYSTDEQIVGTWVDGKPLYQKSVYFGDGILTNIPRPTIDLEYLNVDKIWIIDGTFVDTEAGQLAIPVYLDGTMYVGFYCAKTHLILSFNNIFEGRISNAWATIQYTKTTDTATT